MPQPKKTERNTEICRLYVSGVTLQAISERFNVSRERIRQIMRANNLTKHDRHKVLSDREQFLGVNLTQETKDALRVEAARRGLSMSELTAKTLDEMLQCLKHP